MKNLTMNPKNIAIVAVVLAAFVMFVWWSGGDGQKGYESTQGAPAGSSAEGTAAAPKPVSKTPTSPSMTKEGIYLVYYGPRGFSPATLEVAVGKSVRFVNNSGKAMRLNSLDTTNPIFAAFSQPKTVGQGGIYEYTFIYKGSYGYNNINNPADRGTIVVK